MSHRAIDADQIMSAHCELCSLDRPFRSLLAGALPLHPCDLRPFEQRDVEGHRLLGGTVEHQQGCNCTWHWWSLSESTCARVIEHRTLRRGETPLARYQKFYDAPEVPCAERGRGIGHRRSLVARSGLPMRTY